VNRIIIEVTLSPDMKSTAMARCEELLVHSTVADNEFVNSAVILRGVPYFPDENTRQER
jgi:hypothetical protein